MKGWKKITSVSPRNTSLLLTFRPALRDSKAHTELWKKCYPSCYLSNNTANECNGVWSTWTLRFVIHDWMYLIILCLSIMRPLFTGLCTEILEGQFCIARNMLKGSLFFLGLARQTCTDMVLKRNGYHLPSGTGWSSKAPVDKMVEREKKRSIKLACHAPTCFKAPSEVLTAGTSYLRTPFFLNDPLIPEISSGMMHRVGVLVCGNMLFLSTERIENN